MRRGVGMGVGAAPVGAAVIDRVSRILPQSTLLLSVPGASPLPPRADPNELSCLSPLPVTVCALARGVGMAS